MGWKGLWEEEDVKMVAPILGKYAAAYSNLCLLSLDREYWPKENLEVSVSTPLHITLLKEGLPPQSGP